ncbi:MAG: D-lyxose/D-mannose family sugar isomerase [Planctomycetota bacterium]|nr:MAG: D-lyxose/D-mannose family sugar isomerase [Planctomycetota bacterium]
MPNLVHFGAGNIGRGFISPLFSAAGWTVILVDVQGTVLSAIADRGGFQVIEVDSDSRVVRQVRPVQAVNGRDGEAVAAAVRDADLVSTAVGLGALPHLAAGIARGFEARLAAGGGPLDILVCENGVQAPDILKAAILKAAAPELAAVFDQRHGLVRTSIGRMVPAGDGSDPLDIVVEPYCILPVEASAFRAPIPSIPGLKAKADFDLVLRQKLYLHNGTHACLAYAGLRKGLATIPDCMEDADLVSAMRAAGNEVAQALARAHGRDASEQAAILAECREMLDDLCVRYRNRPLGDPLSRVARDPARKLASDDRLIGAARLCLEQSIQPLALVSHILHACAYTIADDEPQAADWRRLQAQGPIALLSHFSNLQPTEPLMSTISFAQRQQEAAARIRAAGIHLKDNEASDIEIADFGLGRFDELGLAIYVYVNTDRCCAKELAMVPGQICPEHRHPTVDGELGKEETFRCRSGEVHLFLPGHKKDSGEQEFALQFVPADKRDTVTVFKHIHLLPGDQCTLKPNTPHWFVAGKEGAVVSEFSTRSRDEADVFTDAEIQRVPDPV